SSYYLTWSNDISNFRILDYYNSDYTNKTADSTFTYTATKNYTKDFFPGIPNGGDHAQIFSEYSEGEGFHKWVWNHMSSSSINLPGLHSDGPDATVEAIAFSGNNNKNVISNGYNHEVGLALYSKNNLLASKKTLGYERVDLSAQVSCSELKANTNFLIGEVSYAGSGIHVSQLKVTYPRLTDLEGASNLHVFSDFNSSYIHFDGYPTSNVSPLIYDLRSKKRIKGDKPSANEVHFNLPITGDQDFYITDDAHVSTVELKKIELVEYSLDASIDYLIISNKKLKNGSEDYKQYRESNIGGGHSVDIVYVQDLYDQYGYGVEGPLAVRNFIQQLPAIKPNVKSILLLGKGQSYHRIRTNDVIKKAYNLVPAIGHPASDYLYVSTLDASDLKIDYAIGRIPARNNEQINIYLEKLIAYETQPAEEWQKKIIQLAGGTPGQNDQFKSFLNSYYQIFKDSSFGGYRVLFSKDEPLPVQTSLTGQIHDELDDGSSMLSYFGHGAAQVTEISLGEPDQLNNFGKTPIFLFNGCALGNTFEELSLAEKFLFEEKKGALGWVASSNIGFVHALFGHTLEIHKALFKETYGQGIGQAIKHASANYGNTSLPLDVMQSRQLVYHGDPVLDIFSPSQPDYLISSANVNGHISNSDSIELSLEITNLGISTSNLLDINVNISNSQSGPLSSKKIQVKSPAYKARFAIKIANKNLKGLLNIVITLDSTNKISELLPNGESNNSFSLQYLVKQKQPTILVPRADAIMAGSDIDFTIQIPGLSGIERKIEIEVDSTPYFGNPISSKTITSGETLLKGNFSIPSFENKDYYIRCRFIELGEVSDWSYRTFGYLQDENPGWTEGNRWKFNNLIKSSVFYDTTNQQFSFGREVSQTYTIQTSGNGRGRYVGRRILIDGAAAYPGWWPWNGVSLIALNPDTEERYIETNSPFVLIATSTSLTDKYLVKDQPTGIYNFATNDTIVQDSLIAFLNRVPDGYHIIMVNEYTINIEDWKPKLWTAFDQYGISKIKKLKNGEPFAIFATKNDGLAIEHTADYEDEVTTPSNQNLLVNQNFSPLLSSGKITSKIIGPSSKWEHLSIAYSAFDNITDKVLINVDASTDKINWVNKLQNVSSSEISLSDIDAKKYPYLRFSLNLSDSANRTIPQIERWKINYWDVSEGTITLDETYSFKNDTLLQGKPLTFSVSFSNIKGNTYDSSSYVLSLRNNATGVTDTVKTIKLDSMSAFDKTV
ncbi:MAG: C25 family cysteine peptidase, partial [Bacteroidia bacterium]